MIDTFTIQQIEAAFERWCNDSPESFIAELTRPVWKPEEVGEIYAFRYKGEGELWGYLEWGIKNAVANSAERRPLTPDEVPAWKRDKAALKVAIECLESNTISINSVKAALAKIRELTNEDR